MAERWADLTLALALYPETNSRVLTAFTAFFQTLRERIDPSSRTVDIAFSSKAARVGDDVFELKPGSNLAWLKDRLDRADLAGVSFAETLAEDAVLGFTRRLLEVYRRRDATSGFAAIWVEAYAGLTPLERRFDGSFSGQDEGEGLVVEHGRGRAPKSLEETLHRDPRIRNSLESIHAKLLARAGSSAEFCRLDLISEVVGLLPADALTDQARAVDVTANVLGDLEGKFAGDLHPALLTHGDDAAFRHLLFVISRTHFVTGEVQKEAGGGKRVALPKFEFEGRQAALRREDEKIGDDLGGLLADMQGLGAAARGPFRLEDVDDRAEQIGVYLHYLATSNDVGAFAAFPARLGALLASSGPTGFEVLREYLESALGSDLGPRTRALAMAAWLRKHGLREHLASAGLLDGRWACRMFPEGFPAWLETLDFDARDDLDDLDRVCRDIGPSRFAEAKEFAGPVFLAGPVPARLFKLRLGSAGPLVRRIYETNPRRYEHDFARFLRATTASPLDREILDVLEARYLLPDYLAALADQDVERLAKQRPLVVWASLMAAEGDPARLEQHVKAIRLLASFDTPQTHEYLKNLIAERELVVFKKHSPEARRAAVEVLRALEGRRASKRAPRTSSDV